MLEDKVKVIYIVGVGRSGSTLIGRTIAQSENIAFVGEARTLSTEISSRCGCGKKVRKCRFWSPILDEVNVDAVQQARNEYRVRDLVFGRPTQIDVPLRQLAKYYRLIRRESDARVIVDSSSFPSYLLCLSESLGIDVRVLHLIRDPRAIAHSWWKRPLRENKKNVKPTKRSYKSLRFENPIRSSLIWVIWNYVAEKYKKWENRYYSMKYEKFCNKPKVELDRAMKKLGIKERPEWEEGGRICLPTQHSLRGNPNRFEDGITKIEQRSDWREGLSNLTKLLVSGLTAPLLSRYGYSFRKV
jgi:hypothetical protein